AAYLRLDRPQHAEKAYQESLQLNPDSAAAHTGLGRALQAQGRTQEARSEHERALQLDPANPQAHGNLAALLIEEGRLQEAQDELEQGVKDNPERGSYYVWLSELMLYTQNLPAAQKFAQKAVRLLPKSAPAHYQLGRVYLEQERLLQAEQEFRLAVNYDRQFAAARYALGITRGKTGKGILASSGSLLTPSQVGTQGSSRTLQNLQSPGAQDRIQAAVQDPTVLRAATRSYGDTQLDGLFGEEGIRDYALSHLQGNADHRGVWGVTGERQETDGVRANADRTFNRYGVTYGQKAADSPSAFFVLAEREDQEMGLDNLVAPNPFAAQVRYEYELPRLIVGRNFRKNERSQTRFLLQTSALTQRSTDGSAPDFAQRFRDGSFDGELRHDVRLGDRHLLSAGLSGGFRKRRVNSRLPFPPFPPIVSDVNFRVHEWQGYLRDEFRANPHLTLIGEVEVQDLKYRSMTHLEIPFPPFPPLVIDTPLDNDKVLGLPNFIAQYSLDRNSELRFRARRVAGVVQDFRLLRPTDSFFMTFDGLPQADMLEPQGNGQSYEVEYDHSFPNASLLRAGLFRQNLSDADITESSVENGPFPIARLEGARVGYEGLLSPEVSFLLRGDYTSARGVALLGSGALSDTEFLGQVPRYSGAAALQYLNPKGFFVQSLFVYQGKRYHSADDHSTRGGFGVLNLRVGKRHGLRSSVYLGLNNVFGKQYDIFDLLQAGRQWVLGSTWRF
ncbi:MAG: TonB-dependent receptor, partial [Armatimonadetes bacterium]|nr:TonB-dependent receptor [Armatimonadota bacterium]